MSSFHQCSRTIISSTYQAVLDLTTHAQILRMLCQALTNVSATCPSHLRECFAPEDVEQLKSLHLQEMKDYLVQIARNRVTATELEGCERRSNVEEEIFTRPASTTGRGYGEKEGGSGVQRMSGAASDDSATRSVVETTRGPRIDSTARPAVVELTKPPAPLQKPAKSYDDYYQEPEEELRDKEGGSTVGDKKAKDQPASSSPGPIYPLKKEAASIRGDDEGPWGAGEARTLTGGTGGRWGRSSGLLGLCCLIVRIFL